MDPQMEQEDIDYERLLRAKENIFCNMEGKGVCPVCERNSSKNVMQIDPKYQGLAFRSGEVKVKTYIHALCYKRLNKRLLEQEIRSQQKRDLEELLMYLEFEPKFKPKSDLAKIEQKLTNKINLTRGEANKLENDLEKVRDLFTPETMPNKKQRTK